MKLAEGTGRLSCGNFHNNGWSVDAGVNRGLLSHICKCTFIVIDYKILVGLILCLCLLLLCVCVPGRDSQTGVHVTDFSIVT